MDRLEWASRRRLETWRPECVWSLETHQFNLHRPVYPRPGGFRSGPGRGLGSRAGPQMFFFRARGAGVEAGARRWGVGRTLPQDSTRHTHTQSV